jgi:fermentation-respiration switch protein FrsA (DUF1100 family)
MATKIHQTVHSEKKVPHGRRLTLEFRTNGEAVPSVLLLPDVEGRVPAVLLLHGYSSRREHMAEGVGSALLGMGVASLSIDLPLHGTRHDPLQMQSARNPMALFGLWRQALKECDLAVKYLGARAEIDRERLAVAGYSLGSFLAVMVAAGDPSLRAVVVAAGGDLPAGTPLAAVARTVVDPLRAVKKLRGRPLLVVHGKNDRTMRPEQAQRLYDAAGEPREIRWYAAGHILPPDAIGYAARWLADQLGADDVRRSKAG